MAERGLGGNTRLSLGGKYTRKTDAGSLLGYLTYWVQSLVPFQVLKDHPRRSENRSTCITPCLSILTSGLHILERQVIFLIHPVLG